MKIYIPSRKRPNRQPAAEACEAVGADFTIVCSAHDETLPEYRARWGKRVVAVKADGICATRNAILKMAKGGKILMLDDDVRFYTRLKDGKFRKSKPADVKRIFDWFDKALIHNAHAGLTDKFMSQTKKRGVVEHGRYNQALGYNLDLWPRGVKFRIPVNEEHDLHLQLATKGLPPLISNEFSKDAPYYAKGGCATWRTKQVEKQGMDDMLRLWPAYVKLVPTKTQISGLAIRVRWKRAVEDNR